MSHTEHQNTSLEMLRPEVAHSHSVKFPVSRLADISPLPANPDTKARQRTLRNLFFFVNY